jgi:pimeloyl-ACP methyl ester carboxylesterase
LTNTKTSPSGHLAFRIPLDLLGRSIPHIGDFPYPQPDSESTSEINWPGPTLFLKGEHSKYINRRNIPIAKAYFPQMKLEVLDAGHWVHAEQPAETLRLVKEFIEG